MDCRCFDFATLIIGNDSINLTLFVDIHMPTGNANTIARFAIAADASGQITGTFSATSANGAAFGGLTVVGDFPEYIPESFILVVR